MSEAFSRTELVLGKEAMEKLKLSHVAIFGIGGVGAYAVEAMARCGVGTFSLFDKDVVSVSNINRQLIATHKTVGMAKVAVMKQRILDINPEAVVYANEWFYSKENADELDYSQFSYIIDAIDMVSSKLLLVEKAKEHSVPIISSMGAGNKLDPTKFEVADIYETSVCPLAKVMRKELKKRGIEKLKVVYSKEVSLNIVVQSTVDTDKRHAPASVSFVPSVAGLIIGGEVVKDTVSR